MRTKTLILAAAVTAAGLATSMAQTVYSVNTVGYVNLTIAGQFSIISNPLVAGNNAISNLFGAAPVTGGLPANSIIYKFDPATGQYSINRFRSSGWSIPDQTVVPGEGFFIFNNQSASVTNIFIGEVKQGTNVVNIATGFSIIGSTVPQTGQLVTDLKFTPSVNDQIFQFNPATQGYVSKTYRSSGWSGGAGEPVIAVGEGFFYNNASGSAKTWTRVFTTGS